MSLLTPKNPARLQLGFWTGQGRAGHGMRIAYPATFFVRCKLGFLGNECQAGP